MEVIVLEVFVSLLLALGSILLFAYSTRLADHEHSDRLALLPIEPDAPAAPPSAGGERAALDATHENHHAHGGAIR